MDPAARLHERDDRQQIGVHGMRVSRFHEVRRVARHGDRKPADGDAAGEARRGRDVGTRRRWRFTRTASGNQQQDSQEDSHAPYHGSANAVTRWPIPGVGDSDGHAA